MLNTGIQGIGIQGIGIQGIGLPHTLQVVTSCNFFLFLFFIFFFFSENGKNSEVSKGPISFSIKIKDKKKPKIEYRTSVIYKQSCEQGESDEDADEGEPETDSRAGNDVRKSELESSVNSEQPPTEDLKQQMDSIKAAERIGMKCIILILCP